MPKPLCTLSVLIFSCCVRLPPIVCLYVPSIQLDLIDPIYVFLSLVDREMSEALFKFNSAFSNQKNNFRFSIQNN